MSHNSGRQQEDALLQRAQAAQATAAQPDPIAQRQQQEVTSLDDFFSGKSGPIDVRNMPYGGAAISAYNDARRAHDAGRIGGGMGTMTDANPNFTAAVDKENQLDRDMAASGALEGYVTNTQNQVYDKMTGLSTAETARREAAANQAQQAWMAYLNRPQRPNFLQSLAAGLVGPGLSFATGGFGGGGGFTSGMTAPGTVSGNFGGGPSSLSEWSI